MPDPVSLEDLVVQCGLLQRLQPCQAFRALSSLLFPCLQDDDLLYEEELLRNPYSLRMWWRYLEVRQKAPVRRRTLLYERALKALPGSYKVCRVVVCGCAHPSALVAV